MLKSQKGPDSEALKPAPGTTTSELMPYPKNTSKPDFPFKEMKTKNGSGHMDAGKNDDLYNTREGWKRTSKP